MALGIALVWTGAACASSGGGQVETATPAEITRAYLSQVADASSAPRSGRFTVVSDSTARFDGRSTTLHSTVEGWFDQEAGLVRQVIHGSTDDSTTNGSTMPSIDSELVGTRTAWYVKGSLQMAPGVPATQWVKFPQSSSSGDVATEVADAVDPTRLLGYLRRVGATIDDRGSESIDGMTTRHVHTKASAMDIDRGLGGSHGTTATPPPGTTVTEIGMADLDVFIGPENLVRRMTITMTADAPFGPDGPSAGASGTTTIDFLDYGEPVTIIVPRDDETIDGTPYLGPHSASRGAGSVGTAPRTAG